jgi:hypothetical protein
LANPLEDVQQTFLSLDAQYTVLLAACQTDAQRDLLQENYVLAEQNYQSAVNAILEADDAQVAELGHDLEAANEKVKKATEQMGNISSVIDDIDQAVRTGTKLLALAG